MSSPVGVKFDDHPAAARAPAPAPGNERRPDSGEHFAAVDGLEHGAEIVPVELRELHVALDGLPVQTFRFGNRLRPFGERPGKVAAGKIKPQTAG